jgi:lipooligosaccharide transport system permease protein
MTAAIGKVSSPVRSALLIVEAFWVWYRKNWRATVISSVVQPVLFLLALGFGFGSQVRSGAATGGLSYAEYLAPALMIATATGLAAFESTYPVLSAFKWQGQYVTAAATPITPAQILSGQLVWIALRLASSGAAYLVIAGLLGALTGPAVLLALPVSVLAAMAVAAPVVAYAATQESDRGFSPIFRFIVVPMGLLAGTYFPVGTLPPWIRPVAWATPLWHGTELARGLSFGTTTFLPAVGHLLYLVAFIAVGAWLGIRNFQRRLAA